MGHFKLYTDLSIKDVFRLWSATQLQIIIIAGICLPILLLLGLKNGHVAELREELTTSPTGRQVIFWTAQSGKLLYPDILAQVESKIPNTELVIPESQRVLLFDPSLNTRRSQREDEASSLSSDPRPITLYATKAGDPILGQFDVNLSNDSEKDIVISQSFADEYAFKVDDTIQLEASRKLGSEQQSHRLDFIVRGILPSDKKDGSAIGYASVETMDSFELYGSGAPVSKWNIDAMPNFSSVPSFKKMLLICFKGDNSDLDEGDIRKLNKRRLAVTRIDDPDVTTMHGLLDPSITNFCKFYELERSDAPDGAVLPPITDSPKLLANVIDADDPCFLLWNDPLELPLDEKKCTVVGITIPTRQQAGGWINNYLVPHANYFTYYEANKHPLGVRMQSSREDSTENMTLSLDEATQIPLTPVPPRADNDAKPAPSADTSTSTSPDDESLAEKDDASVSNPDPDHETADGKIKACVPAGLLGQLYNYQDGLSNFDQASLKFIDKPKDIYYTKARLYTKTIDDVPYAVDYLASEDFAVLSESTRIAEIHEQDQSLHILVMVVAFGVFIFGVITVFSVLVDSTDRKKGTVGILRVMGTSKFGVFYIVLFRAVTIGLLAAVACCLFGILLTYLLRTDTSAVYLLTWKPTVNVLLMPVDVTWVALGAILCASFGAIVPAFKASNLDPFEAIQQGQFN